MEIKDFMKRNVVSIPADATLAGAAHLFVEKHIGLLPVVEPEGNLVGVLGLINLLELALPAFVHLVDDIDFVHDFGALEEGKPDVELLARPVSEIMRPAYSVKENCGLLRATALMRQWDVHDLPVVSDDKSLVGIASWVDIGTAFLQEWEGN
jgi:CBS domain-containing protein